VNRSELSCDAKWSFITPIDFGSLWPIAVGINAPVRVAGAIESATPITAGPTAAIMPEAAVSGDANMGPSHVHVGSASVRPDSGSAEVTATKVTAGEVAPA
jgi:hypothetical protein